MAEQIRQRLQAEQGQRTSVKARRVHRPEGPCREAHRGCKGRTGKGHPRTSHGWCAGCTNRWYKFGDPFGHAPNTVNCHSDTCPIHNIRPEIKERKRMATHLDTPTGQQFHIRYTPHNGDAGPYWTHVWSDLERAKTELEWYHKNGYTDAKIFVRDVTPWREEGSTAL